MNQRSERRYQYSVFNVCSELHGAILGGSDPLPDAVFNDKVAFLRERLRTWQPTDLARTSRYDLAVMNLIQATLELVDDNQKYRRSL